MAIAGDELKEEISIGEQGEQKSIGEGGNEQEFEARFPSLQAGGFKSQFSFGEAQ
jgi:hypothetical protein